VAQVRILPARFLPAHLFTKAGEGGKVSGAVGQLSRLASGRRYYLKNAKRLRALRLAREQKRLLEVEKN